MVISHEDDGPDADTHPYWYARVIGIFHVNVVHTGIFLVSPKLQRMDFLWVHWFGMDPEEPGGFDRCRLPRVGFVPWDEEDPFGFLDPNDVLRVAHLILVFAYGCTDSLLGCSDTWQVHGEDHLDYVNYYVNMDMFMWYLGGGIGHKGNMTSTLAGMLDNMQDAIPKDVDDGGSDHQQPIGDDLDDKEVDYGYVAEQDDAGADRDPHESGADLKEEEDGDLGPEEGHEIDAGLSYDDYGFLPL
ncbi:hypothetical protein WOLCODRAFT_155177 [Wolfiporia cocos MD-104 SS10]|uniref:Uncharacterized protein n=1 Tax=Wolfiporia cocos (strain MD-104) TaxID=742152 RepID=A0A2H3JCV8_WOLCO|nr:hypothetical protein WOLCODRAFT_155177 [Wolfiporia cocos MD-104 SS10]